MALFGRKIETETTGTDQQSTSFGEAEVKVPKQPISPPPPPPVSRKDTGVTVIGKGITVKGELCGDEDVKIEGRVEGKIKLTKNLLVGQAGIIEADVEADNINIGGTVTGNLLAQNRVEIVASGTMIGDIKAPRVIVAEGAHFKGNVDMDTSSRKTATKIAPPPKAPEKTILDTAKDKEPKKESKESKTSESAATPKTS